MLASSSNRVSSSLLRRFGRQVSTKPPSSTLLLVNSHSMTTTFICHTPIQSTILCSLPVSPTSRIIRTFASETTKKGTGGIEITKTTATPPSKAEESVVVAPSSSTDRNDNVENKEESEIYDEHQMPNPKKESEIRKLQHEVSLHHQHGQYGTALEVATKLLETSENWFGKDHPATATAYNNIGLMNKLMGEFKAARTNYYEALRIYERVVGKDHSSYAAALHNLGNLNRSQIYLDDSITAMERLKLNEDAIEYLEEAYQIRTVELGEEHPHTVASRSNLGSTIATQVLQQMANTSKETRQTPSKLTKRRWEAAEEHLRSSLQTAIHNPRGKKKVETKKKKKKQFNPHKKQQQQQQYNGITTLSAASAAQNLAVFLKGRATAGAPPTLSSSDAADNKIDEATKKRIKQYKNDDSLIEAKQLYEAALFVRAKLLHDAHPDLVATKFSLAELLSTLGDEDGANKLRNEIVDSYDVEESEDDPPSEPNTK